MKLSSQIKFIATIFVVLISINQINGSVLKRSRCRLRRDTTADGVAAAVQPKVDDVIEEGAADGVVLDVGQQASTVLNDLSTTTTRDNATTERPPRTGKGRQKDKLSKPAPYDPPEKTWKALQICGIATFFVLVAYYINKIRKKFERDHENDSL